MPGSVSAVLMAVLAVSHRDSFYGVFRLQRASQERGQLPPWCLSPPTPCARGVRGQPGRDPLSAAAPGREGTSLLLQPRALAWLSLGDGHWVPPVFPSAAHELVHDAGKVPAPPWDPPALLALWLRASPWRVPCSRDPVEQLFIPFLKQDCKASCEKWRRGTQGADGEPGASSPICTWRLSKGGIFLPVELLWLG